MSDNNDFMQQLGQMMGKIQAQAKDMETKSADIKAEGSAGGGMVKAIANGKLELVSIKIEADAIDPNDPEMLEDLVVSAVNQAVKAARESLAKEVAGMAGGLGLPPGMLGR